MIDADIDDAHIASLRMAFFFTQTRQPIKKGHLFLACPPVYRLTQRPTRVYALDDADGDKPIKRDLDGKGKIKVSVQGPRRSGRQGFEGNRNGLGPVNA